MTPSASLARLCSVGTISVGLLLLASAAARADQTTGTLRVRVVAPTSLAAATASVDLHAPGTHGLHLSAHASGGAVATFRGLPPAIYEILVDLPDGAPARASIRVDAAEIVSVDAIVLPAATGGSHVDLVDRDHAGEVAAFRERQLHDLPGGGNLWALLETAAPFVISDRIDSGGLSTARSALIGSRGASWTSTSLSFGDTTMPNPDATGTLPMVPDMNAVESVAVTSGLAPVEHATAGAAITLVPRRPTDAQQGAFEAGLTSDRMVSTNARPGVPSIGRLDSWQDLGLQLGGPIHDRVGAFLSAAMTQSQQQDRASPVPLAASVGSLFTNIVVRPSARDDVRVVAAIQGVTHPYDGRDQFRDNDVSEGDRFSQWQASWDRVGEAGTHTLVSLGYTRASLTPDVVQPVGGTMDRVTDGVIPTPASAVVSGRWRGQLALDPRDVHRGGMDHSLRLGATFDAVSTSSSVLALPAIAELVDGLPARIWVNMAPTSASERHVTALSAYAADRMSVSSNLTVEAGLRVDRSAGSAAGAATGINWLTSSPRLSFRWAPKYGTVFGGYGRYHPQLSTDLLAYGDPGAPWAQVYRWNDANGNQQFDPGELGVLVARAGTGQAVASIDPTLRSPYTDEFTLGAEEQLGSLMTLRGSIVVRHERSLVGAVNVGVPALSYNVMYVPDQGADYSGPADQLLAIYNRLPSSFGQDRFLLTNPAGDDTSYQGIELSWELTARRLYMLLGAMAYRATGMGGNRGFGAFENDQGVVGERFENPNAASYSIGALFFDRSYVAKWSTSYDAPGDLHVGVSARYQDGQPFSRLVIAPDLAQGPDIIAAYRTGRTRFTFTFTLDMRLEKGLTISGHKAALTLDIFNLTNLANEVEENVVTGALFRQATAVQPPRTLRLSFRFTF